MLISGFTFFNEVDLLRLRLAYEHPIVDYIIVLEATRTHAGRPKMLYFDRYRDLFRPYLDKITYVVIDDMPQVESIAYTGWNDLPAHEYRWHLEEHQRNCILRGLDRLGARDDDVVFLTDLDELIDARCMHRIARTCRCGEIHFPLLADYRYTVAEPPWSWHWSGPYATRCLHMRRGPPAAFRWSRHYVMNRLHWRTPVNDLKILRRRLASLTTRSSTRSTTSEKRTSMMDVRLARGEAPIDQTVYGAGITRGIEHRRAGWHLSIMTGGYDRWRRLKDQNFSHAECQGTDAVEDTTVDVYEDWHAYMAQQAAAGRYDFDHLDPDVPQFVRERIRDFPVLLLPRDAQPPPRPVVP